MSVAQNHILATKCELFALYFFVHILPLHQERKKAEAMSHTCCMSFRWQASWNKKPQQTGKWKQKTVRNWYSSQVRPGEWVVRKWWEKVIWVALEGQAKLGNSAKLHIRGDGHADKEKQDCSHLPFNFNCYNIETQKEAVREGRREERSTSPFRKACL